MHVCEVEGDEEGIVDVVLDDNTLRAVQSCTEYFGSSVFANSWDRIVLFGLRSSEIFH